MEILELKNSSVEQHTGHAEANMGELEYRFMQTIQTKEIKRKKIEKY